MPSVTIGVASAPNATGAVFATSATAAALIGRKPSAISITTVIATGVPNPASASSSAPKQNAMMIAWIRWSGSPWRSTAAARRSAPLHREVVDPDRVEHDPQDREEAERRALGGREQRLPDRHRIDHDGHDQRHQPAR